MCPFCGPPGLLLKHRQYPFTPGCKTLPVPQDGVWRPPGDTQDSHKGPMTLAWPHFPLLPWPSSELWLQGRGWDLFHPAAFPSAGGLVQNFLFCVAVLSALGNTDLLVCILLHADCGEVGVTPLKGLGTLIIGGTVRRYQDDRDRRRLQLERGGTTKV